MEEKKEKKVDLDIKIEEKKEWSKPKLLSGKEISFGGFFRLQTGPTYSPSGS
jgi:hypothetical protein